MKYFPIILLLISGCAELQRVLNIAKDTIPPVADTIYPGTGYAVGGGLSMAAGIAAIVYKWKLRKKN